MVEIQYNINDVINKLVDITNSQQHIVLSNGSIGEHTHPCYNPKYSVSYTDSLYYKVKYVRNINGIKEEFCDKISIFNKINTFDGLYEAILSLKRKILSENICIVYKHYIEILDYELMEEKCN